MSRLSTSFVLGYHGCDQSICDAAISGKQELKPSSNEMDWLGSGIYFWEADPHRALEWAKSQKGKRKIANPAVIGAVIDLRNCLNLTNIKDLELVNKAFEFYKKEQDLSGLPLPKNKKF